MKMNPLKLVRYALAGWIPGGRCRCVICGHRVWRFMPYRKGSRAGPPLMHALRTVGSDPDHFECPHCGAHDRERHLLMYLREAGTLEWLREKTVLHFAPERKLSRFILESAPSRYIRADLFPASEDIERVDMLAMQFEDETFDCVIANHVLEHVADVPQALVEIRRVLKPGGAAILQTPYSAKLRHTWEDEGIDDPESRLQAYGQEDHVRLFGRDIFKRIASAGFSNRVRRHDELLADVDAGETGVNAKEPFFLFVRI